MNRSCWEVRFNFFCCDTHHQTRWYFFRTENEARGLLNAWRKDIEVGKIWGDGPEMMFEPVFRSEVRCEECDHPREWTTQTYDSDPKPELICRRCEYHDARDHDRAHGNDDDMDYLSNVNEGGQS